MSKSLDVKTTAITRDLPVKLTEGELASVAREIGRLNKERQTMEAQAKVAAGQWKDRISGIEATIADLASKAADGAEVRPVACTEHYDYRLGEVRVVRADTGEALEVRPMTRDERQPSLPLAEGQPAVDPDAPPGEDESKTQVRGKRPKAEE